jgi:hypothetical protein
VRAPASIALACGSLRRRRISAGMLGSDTT